MDMRRRDLFDAIRMPCVMAQPSRENTLSCRFDRSCCSACRKPNRLNGEWSEMPARGKLNSLSTSSLPPPLFIIFQNDTYTSDRSQLTTWSMSDDRHSWRENTPSTTLLTILNPES
ncbi:hypothetical protein AVEN_45571-1 [Araneus ventricosus]|uniref:Uncharacterized protein n=1 Tax=Araneus ventricosus TaxID=182803 RepID=A0A4Y2UJ71_ARAVE|nr:hypothetical protein AVEN_45571-1 [Araneus ventricosus]